MARSDGKEIYVVDDEPCVRELIGVKVRRNFPNYSTCDFENGYEAQNALEDLASERNNNVGAVVLDNNMGSGPTGLELIQRYSGESGMPPIIFYSSCNDKVAREALKNGAFSYLDKSYGTNGLIETLKGALNE